MKTIDVLNLDCSIPKNRLLLNKFLYKIENIKECCDLEDVKNYSAVRLETLENVFNYFCLKYGYGTQGIKQYYEGGIFIYHHVTILWRDKDVVKWTGNVYGKNMWELFAKMVIRIYADIVKKVRDKEL